MAIDEHVWVSNSPKHTVHRLDPKTNTVVDDDRGRQGPLLRAGRRVRQPVGAELRRQDRRRALDLKDGKVEATLPFDVADREGGWRPAPGSVWMMTDKKGTLARIDPATNKVVAEIYVAPGSYTVAFGENAVWVTSTEKSVLTRVNARTNVVEADDRGRPEAALPRRRRRGGLDDQPGGRLDLARRRQDQQGGRDDRSRASPAAAARSRSATDRCG